MATALVKFNKQTDLGRQLVRGLQSIREGRETLRTWRAVMLQACEVEKKAPADFAVMAAEVGYSSNESAMDSFAEVESLLAKLTAVAGQGDETGAAIEQCCAKHGV